MIRYIIYAALFACAVFAPVRGMDIGKLEPVEVVQLYKENGEYVVKTDMDNMGRGESALSSLQNLHDTASAIIYLDTAEYLLVTEDTLQELESLRGKFKGSVKLCKTNGEVNCKDAAKYLDIHGDFVQLKQWKITDTLPVLSLE